MLESLYRVRGGAVDFRTLSLQPRPFLGSERIPARLRASRQRRAVAQGRAVGAVINGRLYLILLDAACSHYYETRRCPTSKRSSLRPAARLAIGEIGPGERLVPGDVGVGTSMSGPCGGFGWRLVGCPGWLGWAVSAAAFRGWGLLLHRGSPYERTPCGRRGLLIGHACYRPAPFRRPRGRGGIGRRAGFRFQYRKMWGFESLRPHHSPQSPSAEARFSGS